jgi:hypothetical protein
MFCVSSLVEYAMRFLLIVLATVCAASVLADTVDREELLVLRDQFTNETEWYRINYEQHLALTRFMALSKCEWRERDIGLDPSQFAKVVEEILREREVRTRVTYETILKLKKTLEAQGLTPFME